MQRFFRNAFLVVLCASLAVSSLQAYELNENDAGVILMDFVDSAFDHELMPEGIENEVIGSFEVHIEKELGFIPERRVSFWGRVINRLKSFFVEPDIGYFGSNTCKNWTELNPYEAKELENPSSFYATFKTEDGREAVMS